MKYNKSKPVKACLIIYFIILISFTCYILFFTDLTDFIFAGKDAMYNDYSSGWKLDSGEEADISEDFAGALGGTLRISKVLPDKMLESDSIYLSTSNLRFKVYVDGDLIYSFDTQENLTGTGDGISYHMIGLGSKDEGCTMLIDGETVFTDGHGGHINEIFYGAEEQYRYYLMRHNILPVGLSMLMIIFGIVIIGLYFVMSRKSSMMRSLWGLGVSAVLFGAWSLCDTGIPQLLTGVTYATRDIVYSTLHLAGFPMIYFVNYNTKSRKSIFLYLSLLVSGVIYGWLVLSRYAFGADMHTMVGEIYFSYAIQLILLVAMLIDNELFCREKKMSSNLKYFYLGAGVFVATSLIDMIRYLAGKRGSIWQGSWFRFGLVIFFILMAFQIFDWWMLEKTSLERDRFINRLLQYVVDTEDPDTRLNKALEYLCLELHADRAYIFEDMYDGTYDNTYEFCAEGVTPEIDNLKGIPYKGVVDVWYREYEKGGHILIYDLEKYRDVSEAMYNVLKPQGIRTLVTGPLSLGGKSMGFFGVDNPPVEMMEEISEIIRLLMFFLSEMLSQRDAHRLLVEYSYRDSLTGVGNRRAVKDFEKDGLDTSRSYAFIMCDINGLKAVNDNEGHENGDEMIRAVASSLTEIFGRDNVYRMGGDEFAVYSYEDSIQKLEDRIKETKVRINEKGIHVAIGYSFAEGGDADYNAHRIEADNRMYDEKREYYRDGRDRRNAVR